MSQAGCFLVVKRETSALKRITLAPNSIANKIIFSNNLKTVIAKVTNWSDVDRLDIYRAFARGIITEDFEQTKLNNRLLVHKSKYKYGKTKRNNHPDA